MTITNNTRRAIMKAAWTIVRQDRRPLADALRRAWLWMKRKLGLVASVAPKASAPVASVAGWARPVPVIGSTGAVTVWNINGGIFGRRRSGPCPWIGR